MSTALILGLALILDAALGEPKWLWDRMPHPAVVIGKAITWAENRLNAAPSQRLKGAVLVVGLVLAAWLIGKFIGLFGWLPTLLVTAILLAQRALVQHVQDVGDALRLSLGDGRAAVAKIVSRDTQQLDAGGISRSAIESAAENLSDGVIAPAFWFLIAGLPGLLIYKAINTADSMIGYRTERYKDFGWAAAKLDDVLNWLPARITAALIAITHNGLSAWSDIREDAGFHKSPNAGWPEAAMARALNVALAGPRAYDGEMRDFPYVHDFGQIDIGPNAIDRACTALWRVWGLSLALVFALALI
ncbi:adenosylcobinamide-phosphate synthase CbiB [Cognatishimia sp. WU-CL00825]|uniref:adenosylcobinamide-phosphate synthase CbiB n=1 Tax=Cognatishimia sp. WU-CL00825 TaxID=3127658 RepID=UPI003102DE64